MNNDLISREELMKYPIRIDHYDKENGNLDFVLGVENVLEYAESLPAVDAVEVVHGKWEAIMDFGGGNCVGYCSNCHTEHKAQNGAALKFEYRHCRWCGARMDGAE